MRVADGAGVAQDRLREALMLKNMLGVGDWRVRAPKVVAVAMFVLLDVACASRTAGQRTVDPLGRPADMTTALGTYEGYVVGKCILLGRERVFVRGTGTDRILPLDWREWEPPDMDRLRKLVGHVGHSSAFGRACGGAGLTVSVESWKEMDQAIEFAGEQFRRANVSDSVTLEVTSIPRPM